MVSQSGPSRILLSKQAPGRARSIAQQDITCHIRFVQGNNLKMSSYIQTHFYYKRPISLQGYEWFESDRLGLLYYDFPESDLIVYIGPVIKQ